MLFPAESHFVTAPDGLRLHVVECGDPNSPRLPVLCLPGLTRTADDFRVLMRALAADDTAPRRVLALDYRGRGRSDYDPNPANYNIAVEVDDVIAVLTARDAAPAIMVGTSRGGLIAMALAAKQPGAMAGVVLNDIGPEIEMRGLLRIKSYVGNMPEVRSFDGAASVLQGMFGDQFPKLGTADWLAAARRNWRDESGRLVPTYDPKLAESLATVSLEQPLPAMWPQFDALANIPVMVIRGALSDILSPGTLTAMASRHPGMESLEVPDQGHAPLLAEPETIARIAAFAAVCDGVRDRRVGGSEPSAYPSGADSG